MKYQCLACLIILCLMSGVSMYHLTSALAADAVPAATTPAATTEPFTLTDVEGLKLENLRLRRQLAEKEFTQLAQDIQNYIAQTMGAHKNPKGVTFDQGAMTWRVSGTTEAKPPVAAEKPKKEVAK